MASFLGRKETEIVRFGDCYRDFFDSTPTLLLDNTAQFSIRGFLEPSIFRTLFENVAIIRNAVIDFDAICKSTTWEALFDDEPMPLVEENAVEKYAGSLDAYLPANIPVESVLKESKG